MKSSKPENVNLTKYFDASRFWLLLKMEVHRSKKGIGMTLVISLGLLFFLGLLLSPVLEPNLVVFEHTNSYGLNLILGGFILSSLAFSDLGNRLKQYRYLTLPASTLEKFICMWLLTSVGWVILYTLIFTAYTLFANAVGSLLFNNLEFRPFNPLSGPSLTLVKYYLVTQGIFLVGAVHFRGYVFPKTLFVLILLATVCSFIAYFMIGDVMDADAEACLSQPDFLEGTTTHRIWIGVTWLFWWVLAPLCWFITYLGLKDQEV